MPNTGEIESGSSPRKMIPKETQKSGTPRMWPTPSAQQAGDGDFIETLQTKDGKPAEPGQRAYNPKTGKHSQVTLNRAVKMWPTPTARDYKDTGPNTNYEKIAKKGKLAGAVMWPTPQAADNRDRGNMSTPAIKRRIEKGKQVMLSMSVSEKSGALNPEWVEWLMGFPSGWTNLKESQE
jgi:DNA (cytosine-5)-methyltransferase 1